MPGAIPRNRPVGGLIQGEEISSPYSFSADRSCAARAFLTRARAFAVRYDKTSKPQKLVEIRVITT
jgi:hypothetical protein